MTVKKISQFELTKYILENVNQDNSGLNMSEYIILVSLSGHLNSTTLLCNPSKATLANRSCMSERTVDAAITGLSDKGFLTYEKGGLIGKLRKPNSYTLLFDKIYSCVKTAWEEPLPKENLIPQPPSKTVVHQESPVTILEHSGYSKMFHGTTYHSEADYESAKEQERIDRMNEMQDENCPF